MKVDIVVDVGNTRIKWGRCLRDGVDTVAYLLPDVDAWEQQLRQWGISAPCVWAVSGVQPERSARLIEWLKRGQHTVWALNEHRQLPLRVRLEHPDRVGIDRLLNAVAANRHVGKRWKSSLGKPTIIIDAGTAVTVDQLDESGAFVGGTIFPGLRLMAKALSDHTALLPNVEVDRQPSVLGTSTTEAIQAGVYYATTGGINTLVTMLGCRFPGRPIIFLTGGDAHRLQPCVDERAILWPEMTLEGIRIAAEAQP